MAFTMPQLNLKIFLLSVLITALLAALISSASAFLFFLGASLAMLSVAAYSDITRLMLGLGGRLMMPALALMIKIGVIIMVVNEMGRSNTQLLLSFILGLLSFVPAALLSESVESNSNEDPAT